MRSAILHPVASRRHPGEKAWGEWEALGEVLAAANAWVRLEQIDVINVETVVMPCHVDTPAFANTDAPASFINSQHWYVHRQFIRIWYRTIQ